MTEDIIKLLSKQLNKCIMHVNDKVTRNDNREPIAYTMRRNLCEIGEAYFSLINSGLLTKYDETIVRKSFGDCYHILHEKLIHFGNYNSSFQLLVHGETLKKDEILRRTNIETATMLLSIRGYLINQVIIGDSTDDYFLDRMLKLLKGINYILEKNLSEYLLPSFYNLLNLFRTLDIFIKSGHKKYTDLLQTRISQVWSLIMKAREKDEIKKCLQDNLQVKYFYEYCLHLRGEKSEIASSIAKENIKEWTLTQKCRIALNFVDIDFTNCLEFVEATLKNILMQKTIVILDSALVIRLCIAYLKLSKSDVFELDINVKFEDINTEAILKKYINGYEQIGKVELNEGDLNVLYKFNDAQLRKCFAACLQGIDSNEIEMEKTKPHGVSEISDMELRIEYGGHKIFWCLPFKSGAEIGSKAVPVNVAYQIFRPFFHLNSCSVLFVTAKKCSENLINEIKRGRDKFNFSIAIIQEKQLAQLLKFNKELKE